MNVNVVNITEAGGVAGVDQVFQAAPDGYTLGTFFLPRTVQQEVLLHPKYVTTELTPIANFRRGAFVLVVGKNFPVPGRVFACSASQSKSVSVGTPVSVAQRICNCPAGRCSRADFEMVPFSGSGPAQTAVIGGHIDAAVIPVDSAIMAQDELRVLLVPTDERLPDLPDVPTASELGYDSADVSFFQAVFGPPNLPADIVTTVGDAIRAAMSDSSFQKQWSDLGFEAYAMDGGDVSELIKEQYQIVDKYKDQLQ